MEKRRTSSPELESDEVLTPSEDLSIFSQETMNHLLGIPLTQSRSINGERPLEASIVEANSCLIRDLVERFQQPAGHPVHEDPAVQEPATLQLLEIRPPDIPVQRQANNPHCPSTTTFRGDYGFYVDCAPQEKMVKSASYTYDEHRRKLFANLNMVCPFHVHVSEQPPLGTTLRIMAVYSHPNDVHSVVKRCLAHIDPNHRTNSERFIPPAHVIRCESPCAEYKEDPVTGRHSIVIEYNSPEPGMTYRVYHYKFMCLSSCSGGEGMNRRPIKIIFTLEHGNCVLGRLSMDVKICTCPSRDRRNEDKARMKLDLGLPTSSNGQPKGRKRTKTTGTGTVMETPSKPKKFSEDTESDGQSVYTIRCTSRAIYDTLRILRDALLFYSQQHPNGRWLAGPSGSLPVKSEPADDDSDDTPE